MLDVFSPGTTLTVGIHRLDDLGAHAAGQGDDAIAVLATSMGELTDPFLLAGPLQRDLLDVPALALQVEWSLSDSARTPTSFSPPARQMATQERQPTTNTFLCDPRMRSHHRQRFLLCDDHVLTLLIGLCPMTFRDAPSISFTASTKRHAWLDARLNISRRSGSMPSWTEELLRLYHPLPRLDVTVLDSCSCLPGSPRPGPRPPLPGTPSGTCFTSSRPVQGRRMTVTSGSYCLPWTLARSAAE